MVWGTSVSQMKSQGVDLVIPQKDITKMDHQWFDLHSNTDEISNEFFMQEWVRMLLMLKMTSRKKRTICKIWLSPGKKIDVITSRLSFRSWERNTIQLSLDVLNIEICLILSGTGSATKCCTTNWCQRWKRWTNIYFDPDLTKHLVMTQV